VISWLIALSCAGDPPRPEPERPEPTGQTGDTGSPAPLDSDGDGFLDSEDCGPQDPEVYPGATEHCNGLDDDCDGMPDPIYDSDGDGDGFMWCEDCDEEQLSTYPGAPDPFGDALDTDCDGTDGVGTTVPAPFRAGESDWRTTGLALAGGDVDGDGCADLLVGEPGGWANLPPMADSVALGIGCWPWEELPSVTEGPGGTYMGKALELAPGLVVIHEAGWQLPRGRALVYDETFGPEATPRLEVQGGGQPARRVHSLTILGEPAQWLLMGRQPGLDFSAAFYLVDITRTGTLDLEYDEPDLTLSTSGAYEAVGAAGAYVGDVGDRDGDGEVDLGVVAEAGSRQLRFFPQVTGGYADDAPEVWSDLAPSLVEFGVIRTGGDLYGEGRNQAVYASLNGTGQQESSGRAFVLPWTGPGEFDVDQHTPTRLDGEFANDWLGFDVEVADLDGDGQDDLLVGAPGVFAYDNLPGKVLVFRGPLAPGTLTVADAAAVFVGEQMGDHAGAALATGDFDGDGQPDLAIGAPFADRDGLTDAGAVYLLLDPL
jgi:hypothetical protein